MEEGRVDNSTRRTRDTRPAKINAVSVLPFVPPLDSLLVISRTIRDARIVFGEGVGGVSSRRGEGREKKRENSPRSMVRICFGRGVMARAIMARFVGGGVTHTRVLRRSWIVAIEYEEEGGTRRPGAGKIGELERIILDRRKWRYRIHDRRPTNDDGSYAALHPRRAPRTRG